MKKLFLLSALLFFNFTFGQNKISEINGKWIKLKTEMKDGSKLFSRFEEDSTFIEYTINPSQLCINSNPMHKTNQSCVDFKLLNNFMKTSEYSGYLIEKSTKDSLVLSEKIDGFTDDKLRRYYFVKQELIISKFKEKYKSDKNIIASKSFTPKTNSTIEVELNRAFKNNYSNFELIGTLKIFPKERKINTQISFSTQNDSSRINIVKKVIDNSFTKWQLSDFDDYESIELPFVLKSEISKSYWGIKLIFFTQNLNELEIVYGGKAQDIKKSSKLFSDGIKAYQEKKYTLALQCFKESYKIDSKNIDALYNIAAVFFEAGDQLNACITWNEILTLGQVNGAELHQKYCK